MSNPANTTLAPFRPGIDDAEALQLRAEVWGSDHPHSQPAFFRWLFGAENPAGPGSGVMLRRGGRLVGFAGLCPRLARIKGRTVRVAHGLDYMVSPALSAAASGRFALRVAAEWANFARQGAFAFGTNFPNAKSRRLLTSERLKWQPLFEPSLMVRPLMAPSDAFVSGGVVRRLTLRLALGAGAGICNLRGAPRGNSAVGRARNIQIDDAHDGALVDQFWDRVADARSASLVRDAATLRWRYGQHPIYRYEITAWQVGNRIDALIVTTRRKLFGVECILIADALFDPANHTAAAELVRQSIKLSRAAIALAQAVSGDDLALVLGKSGFASVPKRFDPKPFMMVALPLQEDAATIADLDWRFSWGDMDVV